MRSLFLIFIVIPTISFAALGEDSSGIEHEKNVFSAKTHTIKKYNLIFRGLKINESDFVQQTAVFGKHF